MTEMRPPEPNHPLTARRRVGVVADIASAPTSINVNVGGDTTTLVPCAYLAAYNPVVNDVVLLLENGGDYIVAGGLSGQSTGRTILTGTFTATFSSVASMSGTLTFPSAFNTAPVVNGTVVIGANLDILLNWTGAPSTTAINWRLFQRALSAVSGTVTVHWIAIGT